MWIDKAQIDCIDAGFSRIARDVFNSLRR